MKTKAIFLASVLLVGCQTSKLGTQLPIQHAQSLSSASVESEARKYIDSNQEKLGRLAKGKDSLSQPNLWHFVSSELKMKFQDNNLIREQKIKYLKNKSDLHHVISRANPYMYLIVPEIQRRGMPMELILIPIVESAFDPSATSGAGAAGLWQFVSSTGLHYGLKQNRWYDGRLDIVASTKAALDLMENLNRRFDGDWLLTLAAYNSGAGRVQKAISANRRQGKSTNFWELSLPRETSIYVPKMLALSHIIKNHKQHNFKLPNTDKRHGLARVDIGRQMKLSRVAEMSGLSLAQLKFYNAGYKLDVTAPNGPHYIVLPEDNARHFKNSLAEAKFMVAQPARLVKNNPNAESVLQYKVRQGDTLSTIAKRFNIDPYDLQNWNDLTTSNFLKVGQTLKTGR